MCRIYVLKCTVILIQNSFIKESHIAHNSLIATLYHSQAYVQDLGNSFGIFMRNVHKYYIQMNGNDQLYLWSTATKLPPL